MPDKKVKTTIAKWHCEKCHKSFKLKPPVNNNNWPNLCPHCRKIKEDN